MPKKDLLPIIFLGKVVKGRKLGRKIGYPTANLIPLKGAMPNIGYGVYAGYTTFQNKKYKSIMSFGRATTVGAKNVTFEVCLLEYQGNLYRKSLKVEIVSFLRKMKKFNSLGGLILAIKEDEIRARQLL